jgi:hypothetical protein
MSLLRSTGPGPLAAPEDSSVREGTAPVLPPAKSSPNSLRDRLATSFLLFLASAAFVTAAWAASRYRIRLLGSPFPLWIILALNGAIVGGVGVAAVFLRVSDSSEDDPEVVRLPRAQWESMVRRLENVPKPVAAAPAAMVEVVAPGTDWKAVPRGTSPPSTPSPPFDAGAGTVLERQIRPTDALTPSREEGVVEVQDLAERAISTGTENGPGALGPLLESSTADLTRISKLLGAPRRTGEAPSALLIRLLLLPLKRRGFPRGRLSEADTLRRVAQLNALLAKP